MKITANNHETFATLSLDFRFGDENDRLRLNNYSTQTWANGGNVTLFVDSIQDLKTLAFDILTAAAKAESEANKDS